MNGFKYLLQKMIWNKKWLLFQIKIFHKLLRALQKMVFVPVFQMVWGVELEKGYMPPPHAAPGRLCGPFHPGWSLRRPRPRARRNGGGGKARRVLLAEAPLSLSIRRMLVKDEWLAPDQIDNKRAVGEAVAAAFEEMLLARNL